MAIGSTIHLIVVSRVGKEHGVFRCLPKFSRVKALLKLSLPGGVQQVFFAGGFTVMYVIIGRIGTLELAAANVLINIVLVAVLPGLALGIAGATLVGQSLGQKQPEQAMLWGWDIGKLGLGFVSFIGLVFITLSEPILSVFLTNPETLALANLPTILTRFSIPFEVYGLILMNCLTGAGDTKRVMVISIIVQWALFLPLAWLVGPALGYGFIAVWLAYIFHRLIIAASFTVLWKKGQWVHIKV